LTALSDRDQVRLAIGDTDAADPILTDDEVDNFLTARAHVATTGGTTYNIPAAAADCAGAIAAHYAREFDFAEDGQNFRRAQRVGHDQALERTLRSRSGGVAVPVRLAGTETVTT
jgi:hypothetical protein